MIGIKEKILHFLSSSGFGVVGASSNREKYGNKVLRCYLQHGKTAFPVNPREKSIEGIICVSSVMELPSAVKSISIITPPPVTDQVVGEAIAKGIGSIWMQPGAESAKAVEMAEEAGLNVIANGSCLLVVLGFNEEM
jgi:predicted CoA-binding protein